MSNCILTFYVCFNHIIKVIIVFIISVNNTIKNDFTCIFCIYFEQIALHHNIIIHYDNYYKLNCNNKLITTN